MKRGQQRLLKNGNAKSILSFLCKLVSVTFKSRTLASSIIFLSKFLVEVAEYTVRIQASGVSPEKVNHNPSSE